MSHQTFLKVAAWKEKAGVERLQQKMQKVSTETSPRRKMLQAGSPRSMQKLKKKLKSRKW